MSAEVGCAGLLVEDSFCGPMAALPPEGALYVLEDMPVRAGGCAANVAIALAKQSVRVSVAGCVGPDSSATVLFDSFKRYGIGAQGIRRESLPTSKTVILLIEGEDRRYLHSVGANCCFSVEHISRDWVASLGVFYLGGLFGLPGIDMRQLSDLLKFCKERKVLTVVDVVAPDGVKGMDQLKQVLPFIDVFVPSEDEARAFTGLTKVLDQVRMLEMAGANTVIITRGGEGTVAVQDGHIWSSGTFQMNVVDPSGSGDAFTSGVIRSLLEGWPLPKLLRYASAVGASATRATGTTDSVFSAAEAEAFLNAHPLTVMEEHRWT